MDAGPAHALASIILVFVLSGLVSEALARRRHRRDPHSIPDIERFRERVRRSGLPDSGVDLDP